MDTGIKDSFHSTKNFGLLLGKFLVDNGRAFLGIFLKVGNLGQYMYTQMFEIFEPETFVSFDMPPKIYKLSVEWFAFWKFNNIALPEIFQKKFCTICLHFTNFGILGLMDSALSIGLINHEVT